MAAGLAFPGVSASQTSNPQPAASAAERPKYFPDDQEHSSAMVLHMMLPQVGEPSLLEAAKDPSIRSFRVNILSSMSAFQISVRLNINPDGSGQITGATITGNDPAIKRTQRYVSATDVQKFLQMLDKDEFWSMPGTEPPKAYPPGEVPYVLEGSWWMIEGLQSGTYHSVFRSSPDNPSTYRELARYLIRGLAKLDFI